MEGLRRLDQFEFHHVLQETAGFSLVLFTGPACGACRRLKRMLGDAGALFADIRIFEVDVERDLALAREFEVFHLPALFLFQDGEFHCELHSEPQAERLRAAVDRAKLLPPAEAP